MTINLAELSQFYFLRKGPGNTKVVVKAVQQPEEKLTMTASVTGVKTIVAEFNKTIASPSAVKVTVKKGTAARDCKATVDGSKITIAMDTKLMAGTYTVSVEGVDTTAMTADVVVEKNETLTSFEVSPNLTMSSSTATDSAVCYYSALNQYGEAMVADTPDVSSSFSSKTSIKRAATATVKGIIEIKDIPTVLAIQGTEGTIVLVDKNTGVNTNAKVKISAAATAAEATVVGTYNTAASKMESITAGADLGNYYILLTVKDQYGDEVSADDFAKVANISLAGGLTGVSSPKSTIMVDGVPTNKDFTLTSITVDGKEYIAIKLANATAVAGTYTMTIVNEKRGLLSSGTYDVADSVVISSVSITPKNGIYNNTDNEMEYSIVDKDGKEVTSYATLKACKVYGTNLTWEKNADGTAKLIYHPATTISGSSDTASTLGTVTVYANENTSSNYIVKTFTFTISKERKIKTVQGLADGTTTSVAKNDTLKIALDKIVYADQYSNKVTKDDTSIYATNVTTGAIAANATGCSINIAPVDGAFETAKISADGKNFEFQSSKAGTVNVYLKYADVAGKTVQASADNYDFKFTVTASDTGSVAASSLKIKSVNGGFNVSGSGVTLTKDQVEVVGTIGGAQTQIPTSQYVIKEIKNNSFSLAEKNAGTDTKTATVVVQVTTWDANNNATETELSADYTVSTKAAEVFKVIGTDDTKLTTATSGAAVTASALQKCFTFEDQYNTYASAGKDVATVLGSAGKKIAGNVSYAINVTDAATGTYRVTGGGTNGASVVFYAAGTYTVKVTATVNGAGKTVTLKVVVS